MKIALVHDYLVQYGGAERVLECFAELFPYATIYTLVYDEKSMHGAFADKKIKTSYLQRLPFAATRHRIFPSLMPAAIEQFDFSEYDIVLSDSASYAKGIITSPKTLHVCYMHTPTRYAWDDCQKYTKDFYFPNFIKKVIPFFVNYIRIWDRVAADRPDKIIANSKFVAKRIKKYYRKDAEVIYPPVAVEKFKPSVEQGEYYLMVGRLIAYKKHDIAIKTFNMLGLPLKIIGRGPEMKRLKKMAESNIEFLGRISEEELPEYYAKCKAFIFPQEEDFGIVAFEALAAGRPIIAYRGGDIPENVKEGEQGVFFDRQTPEDLAGAIKQFEKMEFDSQKIKESAQRFDRENFKKQIMAYLEKALAEHKRKISKS